MPVDEVTIAEVLTGIAKAAEVAGPFLPSPFSTVAQVVKAAFALAADFANAGLNPVDEIERIHSNQPELAATDSVWREKLKKL
jgi:hypothetical protein